MLNVSLAARLRKPFLSLSLLTAFAAPVWAHVSLEWPAAFAGSGYKASFQIGHGCDGSPTREVSVEIPAGVRGVKPMPRPGWSLSIERAPLPQPETSHGRTVTDEVSRVTWTAIAPQDMLLDAHYGEFVLRATLPRREGALYWPVRQACAQGRHDWVQRPGSGGDARGLTSPAPRLDLMPAAGGAHAH